MNQGREDRVAAARAAFDDCPRERAHEFRALIDALVAELPADSPLGPFEPARARDSTGHSDKAVPPYREAPARGLTGHKGRRAGIRPSGSPRNARQPEEGVKLLTPELDASCGELDDAIRAILALCPSGLGRDREGLSLVLGALVPHLPCHQRSMADYARAPADPEA